MSIFETIMLICFGAAWPVSIYRSYVSRTTAGKSLLFLIIVDIGYVAGILHKQRNDPDLVIYLYILNAVMVFADILLYWRNRRIELRQVAE
ncbi:MAG: hypothetical protein FVQ82_09755 [Planctomycetes bacterium]|nr:hypothetical protein [Planctomycetota bacterium]